VSGFERVSEPKKRITEGGLQEHADILVAGGTLVTCDADDTVIREGAMAIADGRIVGLGAAVDVTQRFAPKETISSNGMLIVPGLIDVHLHAAFQIVMPLFSSDGSRPSYLAQGGRMDRFLAPLSMRDALRLSDGETYAAAMAGLCRSLSTGVTCFGEGAMGSLAGIAQAAIDLGIRGNPSYDFGYDLGFDPRRDDEQIDTLCPVDEILDRAQAAVSPWLTHPLVRPWYNIVSEVIASDELIAGIDALAARQGVGWTSHTATVRNHDQTSLRLHGVRGLGRFIALNVPQARYIGIHMGFSNEVEAHWLADRGASVAHCPGTSMALGKGIVFEAAMLRLRAAGVNVALGTDTVQYGDMTQQMQLAYYGHKEATRDDRTLSALDVLKMATINGAKALGRDAQIGSLEVGKCADFLIINCESERYAPFEDQLTAFVRVGNAGDITSTFVEGISRTEYGRIVGIDRANVMSEAKQAQQAFLARMQV
jgi:5-methylthioadenosine/S-adenosylhomocysteine deaminase